VFHPWWIWIGMVREISPPIELSSLMGYAGASRKSPNDASWEKLSQFLYGHDPSQNTKEGRWLVSISVQLNNYRVRCKLTKLAIPTSSTKIH